MKKIRVLLCDDHNIVRAGMKCLLETGEDIEVVGEAANGRECLREAKRLRPDVVVLDLAMPLLNGMEAARQIYKDVARAKVLVVSSYKDEHHVMKVIEAGVSGYILKQNAAAELLEAIKETHKGNVFFSPGLARHLFQPAPPAGEALPKAPAQPKLSQREAEVLQLIAESYANKQIADILCLSSKTVEKHRSSLMDKLGLHTIPALTRYAIASGNVETFDAGVPADANS